MKKDRKNPAPRPRSQVLSALLVLVFLAALAGANLLTDRLERERGWRVDLSFNALTTAGEVTRKVLAGLPHPVHVYALFSRGSEDLPLLELLSRYASLSDRFTWEQTDVALNPGLMTKFRGATSEDSVTNDSLIVWCEATGRFRVLSNDSFIGLSYEIESGALTPSQLTYESALTAAVRAVVQDSLPRAVLLQGHNEISPEDAALLTQLLQANGYDAVSFSLSAEGADLSPDDLLLLLSPQRDLTDSELAAVKDFADRGGCLLFTCDFSDPLDAMPNYRALLRWYGFAPLDGIVIASAAEKGSFYEGNRMMLLPAMAYTEITAPMKAAAADVLLLAGARGFEMPADADAALSAEAVLVSGDGAYLRRIDDTRPTLDREEGAAGGPFALALLARRTTEQGSVSRAFILGCSTLLISEDIYAMTDAQEFIVRTAEFLLDTEPSDLGIPAKTAVRPQLSVQSSFPGTLAVIFLPALVIAAAFIVLGYRRKL